MKLSTQTRKHISSSIKKVHATGRKMDGSKAAYSKSSPVLSSLDGIGRSTVLSEAAVSPADMSASEPTNSKPRKKRKRKRTLKQKAKKVWKSIKKKIKKAGRAVKNFGKAFGERVVDNVAYILPQMALDAAVGGVGKGVKARSKKRKKRKLSFKKPKFYYKSFSMRLPRLRR